MCLPVWPKAKWFSKWESIDKPIILPRYVDTFLKEGTTAVGLTPWTYTMICRVSGKAL
eukprot:Pgem_evm1s11486